MHPSHERVIKLSNGGLVFGSWSNVVPGDELFEPTGRPVKVLEVFKKRAEFFKVTFNDGTSTNVDADHIWQIRRTGAALAPRREWLITSTQKLVDRREKGTIPGD